MTSVPTAFQPTVIGVRAGASGFVRSRVTAIGARTFVEIDARGSAENQGGALTPADGQSMAAAACLARTQRLPVVLRLASSGADLNAGVAALHGWGTAAAELARCSGVVPVIVIAAGPNVSGPALLLGLADFVVMTADAYAFVVGPQMVEHFTGMPVDRDELGGAKTHAVSSGVASFLAADRSEADEMATELLGYLPDSNDSDPPARVCTDPADRAVPEAFEVLPAESGEPYDVRDVLAAVADYGVLLEPHAYWGTNLVTAFASFGGRPVGIVANQPQSLAGTLDITAARKGARFVAFCDAFNLPLVTFVDTSGFYPGKDLEWRGMIRYGAQMAFAYARATVPRVNVTLRKSYRRVHRDGLQAHGQRRGPGLAHGRDRGDGSQGGGGDPAPVGQRGRAGRDGGGLRAAPPEPVRRRGARRHRLGDRAGGDAAGDLRRAGDARLQAGAPAPTTPRQRPAVDAPPQCPPAHAPLEVPFCKSPAVNAPI